jgi:hypothetical protein
MQRFDYIWVSTREWTGAFSLNELGFITETPPIAYWAKGMHYHNLLANLQEANQLVDWNIRYKEERNEKI